MDYQTAEMPHGNVFHPLDAIKFHPKRSVSIIEEIGPLYTKGLSVTDITPESLEAHEMAALRTIQAGAVPIKLEVFFGTRAFIRNALKKPVLRLADCGSGI